MKTVRMPTGTFSDLDYASSQIKRWNDYRESINRMAEAVLENDPDFFEHPARSGLLFDLILNDYYFRRLYVLRYEKDFFENTQDIGDSYCQSGSNHKLVKAFWEGNVRLEKLIRDNSFLAAWDQFNVVD